MTTNSTIQKHLDLARRFASSLDAVDYVSTAACLAPDCRYEIGGTTHVGPDAIVASYRKSSDWATGTLDDIQYESNVRPGEHGTVVIEFVDHLKHAGITHTHRCEQRLQFDESGLISSIKHVDLAGEQEAMDRFWDLTGLSRP